jgi:amino acid permease
MLPHSIGWFVVLLCFAMIYLVGFFYMRLGGEVISELRKTPKAEA